MKQNPPLVKRGTHGRRVSVGSSEFLAIVAALVVLGAFWGVLWVGGLLTFDGSDPSSKVVAAALGLVGAFFAAVVTLIGLLLKHAIDRRSERREEAENARIDRQEQDTSDRLRLEAATKAIQLLGTQQGALAPAAQRSGAMFMLAGLGQHDFTMALLSDMLPRGEVDPGTAARLINMALTSADAAAQEEAMDVLTDNIGRMVTTAGFEFPKCLLDAAPGLSGYVRAWAPIALGSLLIARERREWQSDRLAPFANSIVAALMMLYVDESDDLLRNETAVVVRHVLSAFPVDGALYHPRKLIKTDDVRLAVASAEPSGETTEYLVNRMRLWLAEPPDGAV
jgi:hypothetical protein